MCHSLTETYTVLLRQNTFKIISDFNKKIHNHKLQTNRWHCNEEPHNNHEKPGKQQSNQLSIKMNAKLERT